MKFCSYADTINAHNSLCVHGSTKYEKLRSSTKRLQQRKNEHDSFQKCGKNKDKTQNKIKLKLKPPNAFSIGKFLIAK